MGFSVRFQGFLGFRVTFFVSSVASMQCAEGAKSERKVAIVLLVLVLLLQNLKCLSQKMLHSTSSRVLPTVRLRKLKQTSRKLQIGIQHHKTGCNHTTLAHGRAREAHHRA